MNTRNKRTTLNWRTAYNRVRGLPVIVQSSLMLLGLPTGHRKVFAIGHNKTATSSIHKIFQKLGMLSLHNTQWRDTKRTWVFLKYQCFTDGAPDDFRVLDRRFKNSKFILNTRDLDEWLDSRLEHIRLASENNKPITSEYWDRTDFAVKQWIATRNKYHLEVLDYFRNRPNDLLVINYIREPDPGQTITDFLGKKRDVGKPYLRSTQKTRDQGVLRNKDLIHRCFNELGVPESDWKSDIHCPTKDDNLAYWPNDTSRLVYPNILSLPEEHYPL